MKYTHDMSEVISMLDEVADIIDELTDMGDDLEYVHPTAAKYIWRIRNYLLEGYDKAQEMIEYGKSKKDLK